MSQPKPKTIEHDPISGLHVHVDAPLGKGKDYGRDEIVKRENARQAALESAIAFDSSNHGQVRGNTLDHPSWDEAKRRLSQDRDRQDLETQADRNDKNELTPRGKK